MACRRALSALGVLWLVGCAGDAPPVDPALYDNSEEPAPGSSTITGPEAGSTNPQAPDAGGTARGAGLCAPCASSDECGGADDLCIDYAEGAFCARACGDAPCPAAYHCTRVRAVEGGRRANQCVRLDETCSGPVGDGGPAAERSAPPDGAGDAATADGAPAP